MRGVHTGQGSELGEGVHLGQGDESGGPFRFCVIISYFL